MYVCDMDGKKRSADRVFVSKAEKRDCFEYLGIDKKITQNIF